MHPTMEQIIGSLVGSGLNPDELEMPSARALEESLPKEKAVTLLEEDSKEEEDAMMKILSLSPEDDEEPQAKTVVKAPTEEKAALSKEESEKELQRLKLRQEELNERFSSLSHRIQALRSFKLGSHVAQQLCSLREMGRKPQVPPGSAALSLGRMEGQLKFLLSSGLDSSATESSSGGESCDEMESYPPQNNQYLPIEKRAKWTWLKNRASLASKWTWLTAQISDLEFKIRQQTELYRQIRAAKPPFLLDKTTSKEEVTTREVRTLHSLGRKIVIKEALLPPEIQEEEALGASRTRPLKPFSRRKRALSTKNLYRSSPQAAKEVSVRCHCVHPDRWCGLCFGKRNCVRLPSKEGGSPQTIALLDHSYHHVISSKHMDVPLDLHMMTKIKNRSWLSAKDSASSAASTLRKDSSDVQTANSSSSKRLKKSKRSHEDEAGGSSPPSSSSKAIVKKKKKKSDNSKSRRRSLTLGGGYESVALQDYCSDEDDLDSSPLPSPSVDSRTWLELVKRRRDSAYDIDNIVIPYSIAASTRVERIKYKEIITPTWRLVQEQRMRGDDHEEEEGEEDVSESTYEIRHRKAELEEQRRWKALPFKQTGGQRVRSRRQDSKTELGSGCNTPDPLSPGMVESLEVSTRPSTPLSEEASGAVRERRRTTSSSKLLRERLDEAAAASSPRSTTPNSIQEDSPLLPPEKPPFEARTFPISESEYDRMVSDMPVPIRGGASPLPPDDLKGETKPSQEQQTPPVSNQEEEEEKTMKSSSASSPVVVHHPKFSAPPPPKQVRNNSHNNNNNSSCEASSEEDDEPDYVMEDDLDWNGDDPNDPEWAAESQSKADH